MGSIAVSSVLRRLYEPEFLVKEHLRQGKFPTAKEAYGEAFSIAWAATAETVLIALIAITNIIMVSSAGETALAAVGLVNQPRFIVQALVMSMNAAVTSICARRRGQGDPMGAISCLKQGLILSVGFSVILSVIAFVTAEPLIWLVGAQEDTFHLARDYYLILLYGIPLSNLSMTISAAQRGLGRTRVSMRINLVASIVNLFFNYVLINGVWFFPKLGVVGSAIGNCIGWGAGFLVAVWSVSHKDDFLCIFTRGGWTFTEKSIASFYKVTSGSFLEQLSLRVGMLLYSMIIARLGTEMLAAHVILQNIFSLSFSFGEGYGISASALVGRNLGARRPDLSMLYGKVVQRMSLITSFILFLIFIFGGRAIMMLFTSSENILAIGGPILILIGLTTVWQNSQIVYAGGLRGAGDTRYIAAISLISIVIFRPVMAYILVYPLGWALFGAWFSLLIDQLIRLGLIFKRFSSGKWSGIEL
ncbi:MAG: MATE family efflux transporter [Oscillospiraceae bacterium]|nr:MATE family efflux transporter [Oscillospiraceae bacterium]